MGMRLALAQINPTVGDLAANAAKIADWIERARGEGADLVLFPELSLPGYPAEDLYLKRHFAAANQAAIRELAAGVAGVVAMVGFAEPSPGAGEPTPDFSAPSLDAPGPRPVHNSLAVLADGELRSVYRKCRLPNYAVFDEARYFEPGSEPGTIEVAGTTVGLTICEDVWVPGPPESLEVEAGAELIVNPSGSPYARGKGDEREAMLVERARSYGVAFAFCNLVGGQDELVFDGRSVLIDRAGRILARARQFEEELLVCELDGAPGPIAESLAEPADTYEALTLGLRDYVVKNGFKHVGVALSGGVDSALVALIAADALGPERVSCVIMPSPHSSTETQADARRIAENLGTEMIEIPIESTMAAYEVALADSFSRPAVDGAVSRDPTRPSEPDLAAENIQARIRGNLMMALSNRFGWLVLTTGNKSELSVGYATLYGDMAGGFAVIKDVPKTLVYELVRHRNRLADFELVPASVLERAPSAELRPDQRDSDSLPPYEVLDRILEAYVERDQGRDEIVAEGLPAETVDEVIRLVDRSEYKRRQAPPGIRITPKAFGRDRRLPITNRFGG
jgi:NAD+ synthase (glutamine-hydrolysing)